MRQPRLTRALRLGRVASATVPLIAAIGCAALDAVHKPPEHITVPGERLFTESLTSAADGAVIIGSVGARSIFRAPPGADTAAAWIPAGTEGLQSVFGVLADDQSKTLWACSNAFGPPGAAPAAPATLYAFDLDTGKVKSRYPLPTAGAMCNDIAVGPDGTAYATDTANMEVVSLKKGATALEVWAGNGAFGPKGGVLDGIAVLGNRVLVNTLVTSKLFSIPVQAGGAAGTVTEVKLDRAIERPDGMRSYGKDALLVTEGGSGGRLSLVRLSGDSGEVTTLKEGFPDGPVSVTAVDSTAYVLEGQLADMRKPPGAEGTAKPFRATAVPLKD